MIDFLDSSYVLLGLNYVYLYNYNYCSINMIHIIIFKHYFIQKKQNRLDEVSPFSDLPPFFRSIKLLSALASSSLSSHWPSMDAFINC